MGDDSEMMFALVSQMPAANATASCSTVANCAKVVPSVDRDTRFAPIPHNYKPPRPTNQQRQQRPPPLPQFARKGFRALQIGPDGVTSASNTNLAYDVFLMLGTVGLVVGAVVSALT